MRRFSITISGETSDHHLHQALRRSVDGSSSSGELYREAERSYVGCTWALLQTVARTMEAVGEESGDQGLWNGLSPMNKENMVSGGFG
ncbi:hypothetical protein L2E82_23102 [Cichorium intybus]|uniref:Uncharacterized protein n=1 Tax=Cichorium intybus TaxID=13427 RepID=A0ACB9DZ62_CICIN|nr:hypothetical protein L2E82_23102 [Cichorium intybus]